MVGDRQELTIGLCNRSIFGSVEAAQQRMRTRSARDNAGRRTPEEGKAKEAMIAGDVKRIVAQSARVAEERRRNNTL